LAEGGLRLLQPVQLEVDEPEVVEQRGRVGALRRQLAVELLRLLELLLLEVDEPQQVQHALVARAEEVRFLQLALRLLEPLLLVERLTLVEMGQEQSLIEGGAGRGVAHASRDSSRERGSCCTRRLPAAGSG